MFDLDATGTTCHDFSIDLEGHLCLGGRREMQIQTPLPQACQERLEVATFRVDAHEQRTVVAAEQHTSDHPRRLVHGVLARGSITLTGRQALETVADRAIDDRHYRTGRRGPGLRACLACLEAA